jgi:hypothetical protein
VRLNRNVSRSGRRLAVDIECEFFVDTFDLWVQKTQGLIVFNFMCEFDRIVSSVGSLSRASGRLCSSSLRRIYRRLIESILLGRFTALTVAFPSQPCKYLPGTVISHSPY